MRRVSSLILIVILAFLYSCTSTQPKVDSTAKEYNNESNTDSVVLEVDTIKVLQQPYWVKNAVIYEVNTRQFSKEGTFKEVEKQLSRIRRMGVDIVWFMPIHEIGVKNRKEGLGSYYSVKDYRSINHEFGTKEDFKKMVNFAHSLGLKVIIDWVANHTAWDHDWIKTHPEYYTKNNKGYIIDPTNPETGVSWGWTDVADLNYDNKELWDAMYSDMAYWVTEFDIDGFRCDVAGEVPTEFWAFNNKKLNEIKPLFMLAESDKEELFQYFNMQYAWPYNGLQVEVNEGKKSLSDMVEYMENRNMNELLMYFTTNHDENTWHSAPMKFEENYRNFAVLTYFMGGMPMIYNGQEARLDHPLAFFTKDEINWEGMQDEEFYSNMIKLYKRTPALWNATNYGNWSLIYSDDTTIAFKVTEQDKGVVLIQNYSSEPMQFDLKKVYSDKSLPKSNLIDHSELKWNKTNVEIPANNSVVMEL